MKENTKAFWGKFFSYNCLCCGLPANTEKKLFCKICEKHLFLNRQKNNDDIISALNYESYVARDMILCMKDYKIKEVYSYAADLVSEIIVNKNISDLSEYYITFAPRNIRTFFKRRFDQSYEIGKYLSLKLFGTKKRCKPLFIGSLFSHEQKTLDFDGRRQNATKSLRLIPFAKVPEKLIILDDVTTTGSTLYTLRDIALKNGAKSCILCAVARQNSE